MRYRASAVTKLKTLLFVLGLTAFLLAGASFQHLHASGEFGLWNEEHDLSLMATFGSAAAPLDAVPALLLVLVLVAAVAPLVSWIGGAPCRVTDSRAPPVR